MRARGSNPRSERHEHRSLLVAVEPLQVEGIRLVDAVAQPLAFDRPIERVAARNCLMDAEAQRDRFVLREQRGRDVEPQQDVAAEVHPRRLLVEQRELGIGGGRGRRRCEHRTEARREQYERDQERAPSDPVHSVRPSTHKPTANGWKPTRS